MIGLFSAFSLEDKILLGSKIITQLAVPVPVPLARPSFSLAAAVCLYGKTNSGTVSIPEKQLQFSYALFVCCLLQYANAKLLKRRSEQFLRPERKRESQLSQETISQGQIITLKKIAGQRDNEGGGRESFLLLSFSP
ncbi:hypothetical protein Pint_34432 [Pistacia integerrima]|uniref:Uncharacterized protein n=1 Tax=Pistacia integerrima TaxID=434235 RepID=A0ACC0X657_9ROSI|nr:hypothetical protein Pint_34432 [Pistacia integerrima]